jgi:flagellar protein FliS
VVADDGVDNRAAGRSSEAREGEMTLVQRDASRTYGDTAVLTATPGQLIVMLYAGALRFITRAESHYRNGNRTAGTSAVFRSVAIIDELNSSLDMEHGEVASRLRQIYLFCKRELMASSVAGDADRLHALLPLLRDLHEAWQEIVERDAALAPQPVAS